MSRIHPPLTFTYRNYRGEIAVRTIGAASAAFRYGSTDWHPEQGWLLSALDVDKNAVRDFAVKDILGFGDCRPQVALADPAAPIGVGGAAPRADDEDDLTSCEGCRRMIGIASPQHYDRVNGVVLCEECAPTFGDMQREPEHFHDSEGDPLSAEAVEEIIRKHLAAGGSLDDKMVSTYAEAPRDG